MSVGHPALPPPVSMPWLMAAALAWVLAWAFTAITTPQPLEEGTMSGEAVLLTDPVRGRYGSRAVATTVRGNVLLEIDEQGELLRGTGVRFEGVVTGDPGRLGAHRFRGRISVDRIAPTDATPSLLVRLGDRMRARVIDRLRPVRGGRGLLAGFLIGDTSGLTSFEEDSMRRAGLSHFVAVSGSNVALFTGLLLVVAGPLALGPKRRALVGLAGLPIYAAATRFEPSVMRASLMAALALGGRLIGVVFEAWQLLALAVVLLLALQPALTLSVGFQLSVAATAGVLVGSRWPVPGGLTGRALAVTIGAQTAVAPLILIHFGSVPLMSPLINLIAGPIVAASTLIGTVGVVGPELFIDVASWLAGLVLSLAEGSTAWPQLGSGEVLTLFGGVLAGVRWPALRPLLALGGISVLILAVLGLGRVPPDSSVTVLDVGQGDAILIHGGDGRFALVDGGPDEMVLRDRLRSYGVDHLELVVLTHVHADHATGLVGLVGTVGIGQVWATTSPHQTEASAELMTALGAAGVRVAAPSVGETYSLGSLSLVVEAPVRRYASPNDQSIVITVKGTSRDMLLAGDIEEVAQAELVHLRADVLKVPHQGAATSDPDWLRGVGAELAVISVGPNQFGHPADRVLEVLRSSATQILRTDEEGDIIVPLG